MKNKIQNLTENEYIELLNTAKAQINAARNVPRNLWNMKLFCERHIDSDKNVLQAVAVLQWGGGGGESSFDKQTGQRFCIYRKSI